MAKRKRSLGYQQALALLKQGEKMTWRSFSSGNAHINGLTVHYPAYVKLVQMCDTTDIGTLTIYALKQEVKK